MEMNGNRLVSADLSRVWQGLTDPEILRLCIPGCESIEQVSDHEYVLTVGVSVGPVKARFSGKLYLKELSQPHTYRLMFEGQGGAVGFAKGTADVSLTTNDLDTMLAYRVTSQIGGKLAQLGSRLIDSTAKKMADEFFEKFNDALISRGSVAGPSLKDEIKPVGKRGDTVSMYWYASAFMIIFIAFFLLR